MCVCACKNCDLKYGCQGAKLRKQLSSIKLLELEGGSIVLRLPPFLGGGWILISPSCFPPPTGRSPPTRRSTAGFVTRTPWCHTGTATVGIARTVSSTTDLKRWASRQSGWEVPIWVLDWDWATGCLPPSTFLF